MEAISGETPLKIGVAKFLLTSRIYIYIIHKSPLGKLPGKGWNTRTTEGRRLGKTEMESPYLWLDYVKTSLARHFDTTPECIALPSNQSRLRLLIWRSWVFRYRVPLAFIIRVLLERFEGLRSRPQPQTKVYSLGISTAALTGVKAKQWLEEAIAEQFPDGENQVMARERIRLEILQQGYLIRTRAKKRVAMLREYNHQVHERRSANITAERHFNKRAWRGNPWL